MKVVCTTNSANETEVLGSKIGELLRGGEVFELASDLGGGKTTFTRGMVKGFGSTEPVSSPSFTINNVYTRDDGKQIWHFDFYRLAEPGIIAAELAEAETDENNIVVVEWGEIVHSVLPADKIKVIISSTGDLGRSISFEFPNSKSYVFKGIA